MCSFTALEESKQISRGVVSGVLQLSISLVARFFPPPSNQTSSSLYSGRTGMVIASVIKCLGHKESIPWVRRVKTAYVETPEQEQFVAELPDVRIFSRRVLWMNIVIEWIVQIYSLALNSRLIHDYMCL